MGCVGSKGAAKDSNKKPDSEKKEGSPKKEAEHKKEESPKKEAEHKHDEHQEHKHDEHHEHKHDEHHEHHEHKHDEHHEHKSSSSSSDKKSVHSDEWAVWQFNAEAVISETRSNEGPINFFFGWAKLIQIRTNWPGLTSLVSCNTRLSDKQLNYSFKVKLRLNKIKYILITNQLLH